MDHDRDPAETREWLDALDSVEAFEGIGRVDELLNGIVQAARRKGAKLPFAANTAYVNTIAPHDEPAHPGDRAIEHRIRSLIRWAVPKDVLEKSILPLIPVNRLGEPEEIARAVVFLAADEAGAITGSTLSINGGQYMV